MYIHIVQVQGILTEVLVVATACNTVKTSRWREVLRILHPTFDLVAPVFRLSCTRTRLSNVGPYIAIVWLVGW